MTTPCKPQESDAMYDWRNQNVIFTTFSDTSQRAYQRLSSFNMRVNTIIYTLAGGLIFAGCNSPAGSASSGLRVTAAEFGGAWPFTVVEGRLRCDIDGPRKYVTLDTGKGIHYALNGAAKAFGFPDVESIQKPGTTGTDLQPFITRGLTLCK